MFLSFLILSVSATNTFTTMNTALSPADIFWPSTWVSSPLSLSANSLLTSSLTITCNAAVFLPSNSYVSISIAGYSGSIPGIYTSSSTQAYQDNAYVFPGLTFSSQTSVYGPVGIVIRTSPTGQVLARTNFFGMLAIAPTQTSYSSLTVTNSSSNVVSAKTSLQFAFSLTSVVRTYDFFVISVDSHYSLANPSITWVSNDAVNYLTNTGFDYSASLNTITVYGIQQDILSGIQLNFIVSGLLNPYRAMTSGFNWVVTFYRFGTTTVLQQFQATSSPNVISGTVTATLALNSNYVSSAYFVSGMSTYVTLTVAPQHAVVANGRVTIAFSGITLLNYINSGNLQSLAGLTSGQYVTTDSTSASYFSALSISGNTVTLTIGSNAFPSSSTFSVNLLGTVTSGSSCSITTADSSGNIIDISTISSLYKFTSSGYQLMGNEPGFNLFTGTGSATISTSAVGQSRINAGVGFWVDIVADTQVTSGDKVYMNLPLATSTSSAVDYQIGVGSSLWGQYLTTASSSSVTNFGGSTYPLTSFSSSIGVTTNSITVTVGSTFSAANHINFIMGSGNVAGTYASIFLPNFPSSVYTKYEILIYYQHSAGTNYVYSKPLYFAPESQSTLALTLLGTSKSIAGLPAQIVITPVYSSPVGYVFSIDYTITSTTLNQDLSSGILSGSPFPGIYPSGASAIISYSSNSATTTDIIVTGVSSFTKASPITVVLPFDSLTQGVPYSITATITAIRNDGGKILLSTLSGNSVTGGAAIVSLPAGTYSSGVSSATTPYPITTYTDLSTVTISLAMSAATTNQGLAVIFPQGFIISSTASLSIGGSTVTPAAQLLNSSNTLCKYQVLYFSSVSLSSSAQNYVFTGIKSSLFVGSTATVYFYATSTGGFSNTGLGSAGKFVFNISPNTLTYVSNSYSPAAVAGFGPDNSTFTLSISFTLPGPVYGNNSTLVVFSIDASLGVSSSVASISAGTYSNTQSASGQTFTSSVITSNLAAGSTLTLSVSNVVSPSNIITPKYTYGFSSVYVKCTAGSTVNMYSWLASVNDVGTTIYTQSLINVPSALVASTITSVSTFPNVQGATSVYFEIQFFSSFDLPIGTVVTISGDTFDNDPNAIDNTWCTYGFSNSQVLSGKLVVTLQQYVYGNNTILIRKDKAFTAPQSATGTAWLIGAVNNGATILNDATTSTIATKITYVTPSVNVVNSGLLTNTISNTGYTTWFNFNYVFSADFLSTYSLCIDLPKAFDQHFGKIFTYTGFSTLFYLNTQSLANPYLTCYVDHWVVTCSGFGTVKAGNSLNFSIEAKNPSSVSQVFLGTYVIDSNQNLKFVPYYGLNTTFTPIAQNNADLHYVTHSLTSAPTSNLLFSVLLSENYPPGSKVTIEFPDQYLLIINNLQQIGCSATYYANPPVSLVSSGTCSIFYNTVTFTINNQASVTTSNYTVFEIDGVVNPLSGLSKGGYDSLSSNQNLFNVYDFWTNTFRLNSFATNATLGASATSSYYYNLGAAYTGYKNIKAIVVSINKGNPIIVQPGAYSLPLSITVPQQNFKAVSLTLSPVDLFGVSKFDNQSYILTSFYPKASFRIGVPTGTPTGLTIVRWSLAEVPLASGTFMYSAPPNSMIQIYPVGGIVIKVGSISNVPPISISLPIKLDLNGQSPFSDLTISFVLTSSDTTIQFNPSSVTFNCNDTAKYFVIQATANTTVGKGYTFNYTISGTDSASYLLKSHDSFSIGTITSNKPSITDLQIVVYDQVSADILLTAADTSTVTWAFGATNVFLMNPLMATFNYASALTAPLFGTGTSVQTTTQAQINAYLAGLLKITDNGDWNSYSRSVLLYANSTYITGSSLVTAGTSTTLYSFSNLVAGTSYTLYVWADNYSGNTPASKNLTKTTKSMAASSKISLTFGSSIPSQSMSQINQGIALAIGVQSDRVQTFGGLSRRLATMSSSIYLPNPLTNEDPSVTATSLSASSINNAFSQIGLNASVSLLASSASSSADFALPYITGFYGALNSATVVTLNYTTSSAGPVCWVVELNPLVLNNSITSNNILYGLNRDGTVNNWHGCVTQSAGANALVNWNFTAMNSTSGTYVISTTACNNAPITPVCVGSNNILSYSFVWKNSYTVSFSKALGTLLVLIGLLI